MGSGLYLAYVQRRAWQQQQQRRATATPPIVDLGPAVRDDFEEKRTRHLLFLKYHHTTLFNLWSSTIDNALSSTLWRTSQLKDHFEANGTREYLPQRLIEALSVTSLSQCQKILDEEIAYQVGRATNSCATRRHVFKLSSWGW
jgi:hypothetical protein